jgi:FkbM family methyltransferase
MFSMIKSSIHLFLYKKGLKVIGKDEFEFLSRHNLTLLSRWWKLGQKSELVEYIVNNFNSSKSQIQQDLLVKYLIDHSDGPFKANYFVEFGATDGILLSNTYLLENNFGWDGIVAEPAKIWQKELRLNRKCHIDESCVFSHSGLKLEFNQTRMPELSTIQEYSSLDSWVAEREDGMKYDVNSISLNDLLGKWNAPNYVSYLSIDTEGSEFSILETVDFKKWKFGVITVEHNYSDNRALICKLLVSNGYKQIYSEISLWDDWYVNELLDIPNVNTL